MCFIESFVLNTPRMVLPPLENACASLVEHLEPCFIVTEPCDFYFGFSEVNV